MFTRILIFIASLVLGYLGLRYNYWVVKTVGKSQWVENKFGAGMTFAVYQLMALIIIILGFAQLIGAI